MSRSLYGLCVPAKNVIGPLSLATSAKRCGLPKSSIYWVIALLCSALRAQAAPETELSREFQLTSTQARKIRSDLPATSIAVDDQQQLWILGQRSLWLWSPQQKRLRQIRALRGKAYAQERFQAMQLRQGRAFVATDRYLLQISFDPLQMLEYAAPQDDAFLGFVDTVDQTLAFSKHQVFRIQPEAEDKELVHQFPTPAKPTDQVLERDGTFWRLRGRELSLNGSTVFQASSDFVAMTYHANSILAHTKYTLLRFQMSGKVFRTIPVQGDHKFVAMDVAGPRHYFFFSDRMLEVKTEGEQRPRFYFLDIGRVKKASAFVARESTIAMILDGKPRVFQLAGTW